MTFFLAPRGHISQLSTVRATWKATSTSRSKFFFATSIALLTGVSSTEMIDAPRGSPLFIPCALSSTMTTFSAR